MEVDQFRYYINHCCTKHWILPLNLRLQQAAQSAIVEKGLHVYFYIHLFGGYKKILFGARIVGKYMH